MGLSENIKKYRKNSKLTQAQLAEKSGISSMSIRRYESGERNPKAETIQKIADALNINILELLGFTEEIHGTYIRPECYTPELEEDLRQLELRQLEEEENKIDESFRRVSIDNAFNSLNVRGQIEAVHRVEELTKVPEYQIESNIDGVQDDHTQNISSNNE